MSNYNSLKTTIDANIKQNGRQEITGQILNSVLNQMVTTLGAGYQFAGVATLDPATDPGTPDAKVFYIANGKGTYTNFGGVEVTEDDVVVLYWDSSWHKVSTGIASNEKLSELGQKLGEFQPIENPLINSALSQYINSQGQPAGGGGYFYSRPFSISKGDSVKYIGVGDGCIAISLCDNVPTFPVIPVVRSINDGQTYTYEYTAESDGYYLISGLMSGFVSLYQRSGDSTFALIAKNTEDIAQNTEDIAQLPIKIYDNIADNLIDINAIEEKKYVKYDSGGVYSISDTCATDFIPVNEDDELSFINVFMATSDTRGLAWYSTQKDYLGGIQYNGVADDRKIIVPKGARYLRASFSIQNIGTARIICIAKTEQADCSDLLINTLCVGDSLTSGADYTTGTYLGNMRENYPYYLKKMSHINVDYVSRPGWSAKDWWRDYSGTDFSLYDSFIVWLGTNEGLTDTLNEDVIPYSNYVDFANTNTGCYCKIISKMIEQTPDARIFLVNCWATSGNLATTNSVIQKIAELYPNNVVGIIDMVNSGLWDKSNQYLNHIINNIHFSRVGNLFLANYIYENVKKLIYRNLQKFNFLILNYGG